MEDYSYRRIYTEVRYITTYILEFGLRYYSTGCSESHANIRHLNITQAPILLNNLSRSTQHRDIKRTKHTIKLRKRVCDSNNAAKTIRVRDFLRNSVIDYSLAPADTSYVCNDVQN